MNSELASASPEISGQNEGHEGSAATAAGSEASVPGAAAAAGEGPQATSASDEGSAKPAPMEHIEPSEAEKEPSAGESGKGDPALAAAPSGAAAGEGLQAASASDEGPAERAPKEPSEAEKKPQAGEPGMSDPAGSPPLAAAPSGAAADNPLESALAALDRRDYGSAKRLFESLGRKDAVEAIENALKALDRKDYPAAQALFEALALKPSPSAGGASKPVARIEPEPKPVPPPNEIVPVVNPVERPPAQALRAKKRGARGLAFAACLALLALLGASYVYGWRGIGAFFPAKTPAAASVAAADSPALPKATAAAASGGEDERAELRDLKAALADATARLDRIEQDFGARLDKLGENAGQGAASGQADVTARLDALEKTAAATAQPAAGLADVEARLDRLEKSAGATAPASAVADLSTRLYKLEKHSETASAARSAVPLPPPAPKRPAPAKAQPSPNDAAGQSASRRLLPDFAVEDVQDGVAVVASRYGPQQVAPGDFIPGAGRVLRIERHGGAWYVLTSNGVIASSPEPY